MENKKGIFFWTFTLAHLAIIISLLVVCVNIFNVKIGWGVYNVRPGPATILSIEQRLMAILPYLSVLSIFLITLIAHLVQFFSLRRWYGYIVSIGLLAVVSALFIFIFNLAKFDSIMSPNNHYLGSYFMIFIGGLFLTYLYSKVLLETIFCRRRNGVLFFIIIIITFILISGYFGTRSYWCNSECGCGHHKCDIGEIY